MGWPVAVLEAMGKGDESGVREGRGVRVREAGYLVAGAAGPGEGPAAPAGAGGVEGAQAAGRDFRVVLIKEGLAKSGRYFTRGFVEQVAAAAEGLRAFADHPTPTEDRERPARSVRDVVGFYRDACVAEVEAADGAGAAAGDATGRRLQAEATLHLFESAEWLAAMVREVLAEAPEGEVIGLSIDSVVRGRIGRPAGVQRDVRIVEELAELRSVDVVTRPSAGGEFRALAAQESEEMEEEQVEQKVEETAVRVAEEIEERGRVATSGEESMSGKGSVSESGVLAEAERVLAEVKAEQYRSAAVRALEEQLGAAEKLPAVAKEKLRRQLAPRAGEGAPEGGLEAFDAAVEAAIAAEAETVEAVRREAQQEAAAGAQGGQTSREALGSGRVAGYGVVVTAAEPDRQRLVAQLAMDRLFGLPVDGQDGDDDAKEARSLGLLASVPRWSGIREAYVQLTGDALVTGVVRADESIVREANEVTTGVLNMALLNSMTKRLVRDYRGQEQTWRKFCEVVPLQNFRSQDRVRLHDFASLATVAEGAAYANLAWDDSRETYTPAKRGNLVVVTREAILNDDLRAIRRIPQKLARAAHITINEFVYGLFTTNPLMNDGSKVFDDGVQATHGNRGTTALSSAALQSAITSMMKQTDSAGKRLNLKPRYLLVPADLLFTATTLVNSTLIPGSANNDANVLKGAVEPIAVAQLTDATDYYLICDPRDIESIEIGFVGGKEEPELLLQDAPLLGQVFTNDQMSFKVRWEFGGGWLDYRGAFWGNVA